ncbi:ABC transporter permease [Dermatophilaceae bacterium Soc4.6]
MTDLATTPVVPTERLVPRFGGVNRTLVGIELKRLLRNRRSMIFTIVMPAAFFLIFGVGQDYGSQRAAGGNVTAYVMVSMALYGAMIATTGAGAMVATERAQGWSRQLRLTPLRPVAYVVVKVVVALLMGLIAITVVYVLGLSTGAEVDRPSIVVTTALIAWAGSLVFAAFGLFVGYLLPSENVMQVVGPGLALLAFGGGVFIPLTDGSGFEMFARFTPMYGVAKLARLPLTGDAFQWWWLLNIAVWLAVFAGGAALLMSRDTDRV